MTKLPTWTKLPATGIIRASATRFRSDVNTITPEQLVYSQTSSTSVEEISNYMYMYMHNWTLILISLVTVIDRETIKGKRLMYRFVLSLAGTESSLSQCHSVSVHWDNAALSITQKMAHLSWDNFIIVKLKNWLTHCKKIADTRIPDKNDQHR